MRVPFNPQTHEFWKAHYAQKGAGSAPFKGYSFQRGSGIGNVFSGLLRTILPIAKSAGKAVGKQALRSGVDIASDVLGGRDPGEAVMAHSRAGAAKLVRKAARKTGKKKGKKRQAGKGIGKRPKSINTTKRVTKRKRKTKRTRKRDALGLYLA